MKISKISNLTLGKIGLIKQKKKNIPFPLLSDGDLSYDASKILALDISKFAKKLENVQLLRRSINFALKKKKKKKNKFKLIKLI